MHWILPFVCAAAVATAQATPPVQFSKPHFCHGLDCPEFEVLKDVGRDGELRRYAPGTWVTTDAREGFLEKAYVVGFQRLFKYLSGYNELQESIEMTTPVVTQVRLTEDDKVQPDFTVSLILPYMYQKDQGDSDFVEPPAPSCEKVELTKYDETDFYVLPFSLYALGIRVKPLALGFFDFLERNGHTDIDRSQFFVAQYDPPYRPYDRHNEIWVLRTGEDKKKKHHDEERKGGQDHPLWPYDIVDPGEGGASGLPRTTAEPKRVHSHSIPHIRSARHNRHQ